MKTRGRMIDFTGVSGNIRLQNLYMVLSLEGAVIIWANISGLHPVIFIQVTPVSFVLHDDVFWIKARGQTCQDDVCVSFGCTCDQGHISSPIGRLKNFLTPLLFNMKTRGRMNDFTGVSGNIRLQNLYMVRLLEGAVIIWANISDLHPVLFSQDTPVSFDLHDDVFWIKARGQTCQDDVCVSFGRTCEQVHI
ncbi:hypothetical protein XENOCAPTIV_025541, partial [Xenoophorus captivus]